MSCPIKIAIWDTYVGIPFADAQYDVSWLLVSLRSFWQAVQCKRISKMANGCCPAVAFIHTTTGPLVIQGSELENHHRLQVNHGKSSCLCQRAENRASVLYVFANAHWVRYVRGLGLGWGWGGMLTFMLACGTCACFVTSGGWGMLTWAHAHASSRQGVGVGVAWGGC